MKLFISWSGAQSRALAETFKDWIPSVIQAVKPYFSPDDIHKGARWSHEIAKELEGARIGVICVTPDNLNAPWIMFEAGALSKNLDKSRVCPILFGVEVTDVQGPLLQFQAAAFSKIEMKKLVQTINGCLDGNALDNAVLNNVFDTFWPQLEKQVEEINKRSANPSAATQKRSPEDMLKELLILTRSVAWRSGAPKLIPERSSPSENVPVLFDEEDRKILFFDEEGEEAYYIDLDRVDSGSELADWILQIHGKGWCTPWHVYAFIDLIEELSNRYHGINAQGIFCPFGKNTAVEWPKNLTH